MLARERRKRDQEMAKEMANRGIEEREEREGEGRSARELEALQTERDV